MANVCLIVAAVFAFLAAGAGFASNALFWKTTGNGTFTWSLWTLTLKLDESSAPVCDYFANKNAVLGYCSGCSRNTTYSYPSCSAGFDCSNAKISQKGSWSGSQFSYVSYTSADCSGTPAPTTFAACGSCTAAGRLLCPATLEIATKRDGNLCHVPITAKLGGFWDDLTYAYLSNGDLRCTTEFVDCVNSIGGMTLLGKVCTILGGILLVISAVVSCIGGVKSLPAAIPIVASVLGTVVIALGNLGGWFGLIFMDCASKTGVRLVTQHHERVFQTLADSKKDDVTVGGGPFLCVLGLILALIHVCVASCGACRARRSGEPQQNMQPLK